MTSSNIWPALHASFQEKRIELFFKYFSEKTGRLLDLGGGDGSFLVRFRSQLKNFDIYVADIDEANLEKARNDGFRAIRLDETGNLPFEDCEWDLVFCNSVIEHCTGPKQAILSMQSSKDFCASTHLHQKTLAAEIRRVSKSYFVQTPHRGFPIKSHTLFPFTGYLPRSAQLRAIRLLNKFWIKKTQPDWYLLGMKDMRFLFPDARIVVERFLGLPKSLVAIRS